MIHLVVREPLAYKRTLCQALSDSYKGSFIAWFAGKDEPLIPKAGETFTRRLISDVGYSTLYRELRSDPQAIVILGSWSSAFARRTLLITQLLHVPVFIWTDHPHPRQRSWVFDRLRKIYLRFLANRVAGFLACGKPTVSHLESLGIPSARITNFPYWVSIPEEWSLPERCQENQISKTKPLHLIAIGRHVPVKAFEVAIEGVALANRRAGFRVATLELIGDGPERKHLEELARSLDLEDVVEFPGWLSNDAARSRLRDADALVVTSTFEPYGVVVLEALASGRAVLASNGVIAARDRDDGFGAILFHPPGDAEFLAQQIKLLAGDQNVLRMASEAARAIAEEWPLTRAAAMLQPFFDHAIQDTRQGTAGELNCGLR
jgi:glycosyltransferase involved in cell wall biosynthesis